MVTIDVRESNAARVEQIIFAERVDDDIPIAYKLVKDNSDYIRTDEWNAFRICDEEGYSLISSAAHARDLIKSLEIAISLGWVK